MSMFRPLLAQVEESLAPIILVIVVIVFLIIMGVLMSFYRIWIRALVSGARVSFFDLIRMKLRRVPPSVIIDARIIAVKAGLAISINELETHYMVGGNVGNVVRALVAADKADMELDFKAATAIDLAGRDVLSEVQKLIHETTNNNKSGEKNEYV